MSSTTTRWFAPITAPLGAWSCDYFYFLTLLTFFVGAVLGLRAIAALGTGTGTTARTGALGAAGLVLALLPLGLAYFNARILYSMCTASIGDRRGDT